MSRIARKPVMIPAGVKVAVNATQPGHATAYPCGSPVPATSNLNYTPGNTATNAAIVDIGSNKAFWGTTRALIATAVEGVLKGYERKLEIVGVGWGAKVQGKKLVLTVGYANTLDVGIPEGVKVEVNQTMVTVSGPDKQAVGEFASKCRAKRKPEPYNGKGIKYTDEVIQRKQGKAFGS